MILARGVHEMHSPFTAAAAEPSLQSLAASCLDTVSVDAVLIDKVIRHDEDDDHA